MLDVIIRKLAGKSQGTEFSHYKVQCTGMKCNFHDYVLMCISSAETKQNKPTEGADPFLSSPPCWNPMILR